jgi:hypothetical protein
MKHMKYTVEKKMTRCWYVYFSTERVGGSYRLKRDAEKIAHFMGCGMSLGQAEERVLGV